MCDLHQKRLGSENEEEGLFMVWDKCGWKTGCDTSSNSSPRLPVILYLRNYLHSVSLVISYTTTTLVTVSTTDLVYKTQ